MTDESGAPDLNAILQQLGQVKGNLEDAQDKLATETVKGTAGGGKVTVEATASLEFNAVTIDPSVVDAGEVEMLQDLVLAALRDTVDRAQEAQARVQQQAMGGLGLGGGIEGLLGS